MAKGNGSKKNTTSASGYKAGGGSQAKSEKSPKTKGMSPSQIAGIAASIVPAGKAIKVGAKAISAVAKAAPGLGKAAGLGTAGGVVSAPLVTSQNKTRQAAKKAEAQGKADAKSARVGKEITKSMYSGSKKTSTQNTKYRGK